MGQLVNLDLMRARAKELIQGNPTQITVTRTDFVSDGAGGWIEQPSRQLAPQTVRLFQLKPSSRDISDEGARGQVHRWGLIGDHTLDLKRGDTFDVGDMLFVVQEVIPSPSPTTVVSVQAELSVVLSGVS